MANKMQLLALALAFEEEEGVREQPRHRLWVHEILVNRESQGALVTKVVGY